MLARIFHGTAIVPKGLFEIDEETKECKVSDEFTMPPQEELKSLEAWGNYHPNILGNGRVTHLAPENITDEAEQDAWKEEQEIKDKTEERFRGINEQTPMPGT